MTARAELPAMVPSAEDHERWDRLIRRVTLGVDRQSDTAWLGDVHKVADVIYRDGAAAGAEAEIAPDFSSEFWDAIFGGSWAPLAGIGKYSGANVNTVREVIAEAKAACPRAADVIAALVWWQCLNRQREEALRDAAHRDGTEAERERIRKMLADDAVVEAATVAAFEEEENARRALGIQRTEWAALGSSFQDNWRSKTRASFRDLAALLDAEAGDA